MLVGLVALSMAFGQDVAVEHELFVATPPLPSVAPATHRPSTVGVGLLIAGSAAVAAGPVVALGQKMNGASCWMSCTFGRVGPEGAIVSAGGVALITSGAVALLHKRAREKRRQRNTEAP